MKELQPNNVRFITVVGDINIMKTTFELNFDLYQAFKHHEYKEIWNQREAVNLISFSLISLPLRFLSL